MTATDAFAIQQTATSGQRGRDTVNSYFTRQTREEPISTATRLLSTGMHESIEFRIPEEHAARWLASDDGVLLGGLVRKLAIPTSDSRMRIIEEADRALKEQGRAFFTAWKLRRTYSKTELERASVFRLKFRTVFEPPGEACGTKYDESNACPRCGAGAKQVGPLFLDLERVPKAAAFAKTIAGEVVVSERVRELFEARKICGATFHPVHSKSGPQNYWNQLVIDSAEADVVAPTRAGIDPFDNDPRSECRCAPCDVIGLNLLSEVSISSATWSNADIFASRQFIGVRRGFLRPERVILVSQAIRKLIDDERLNGCEIEVAHLV